MVTAAVPEPTLEGKIAEAVLKAIRDYDEECEAARKVDSQRVFGHPGAHIPDTFPTNEGRRAAIAAVLPPLVVEVRERAVEEALEAAADDLREDWVKNGRHQGLPGCYSSGYERWLRDRARIVRTGGRP